MLDTSVSRTRRCAFVHVPYQIRYTLILPDMIGPPWFQMTPGSGGLSHERRPFGLAAAAIACPDVMLVLVRAIFWIYLTGLLDLPASAMPAMLATRPSATRARALMRMIL